MVKGYVNGSGAVQFGSDRPPEDLSIAVPVSVPGANLSPFLCKPFVETSSKATYGRFIDPNCRERINSHFISFSAVFGGDFA